MATLQVFYVEPDHTQHPDPNLRQIPDGPIDAMRKEAVKILKASGLVIRSVNFKSRTELVGYVYEYKKAPRTAQPLRGWVYRKPTLPSTT